MSCPERLVPCTENRLTKFGVFRGWPNAILKLYAGGERPGLLKKNTTNFRDSARPLLRWRCGLIFTGRRDDALQSQIGDHVPIVLIRVRRIDGEQRQFGYVEVE